MTASRVPRVSHLSCWRSRADLGPAVTEAEDDGGDHIIESQVAEGDLIEPVEEEFGRRPGADSRVLQSR